MKNLQPLGRRAPADFVHVERFPLTVETTPQRPTPVAIGVNWYENFDSPEGGWIGRGNLGAIRGGHCVCLLPARSPDAAGWWDFYDQGREGACVGFGASRMMSHLNRKRYDARWLWNEAKKVDEWADTNPGDDNGTSVRAACDVLRKQGHVALYRGKPRPVTAFEGISANRWATSVDQILRALGTPTWDHVRVLNSWGRSYPRVTRLPGEVLERLIVTESGEACLVTDR